jgi:hypothetical protein
LVPPSTLYVQFLFLWYFSNWSTINCMLNLNLFFIYVRKVFFSYNSSISTMRVKKNCVLSIQFYRQWCILNRLMSAHVLDLLNRTCIAKLFIDLCFSFCCMMSSRWKWDLFFIYFLLFPWLICLCKLVKVALQKLRLLNSL